MRLLVIKNSKHNSIYATCIYTLLEDIWRRNGYPIVVANRLNEAASLADNTLLFVTIGSTSYISRFIQQQRLVSFIKRNKTDLLVQNANTFIKQKKIPQLLIADDTEQLPAVKKISYSKIFVLTYSHFAKQVIADKGFTNIVHVIPFFVNPVFQPVSWSAKQQVKMDYTEGCEYFYMPQDFKNMDVVLKILKAFTGFKKWQHSSMKLVIGGKLYLPAGEWEEKWSTYKYREDVLVYNTLPEDKKAKLLAGAYACILLPEKDNKLLYLMQSIQSHTPLIAFESTGVKEYAANATLTAAADNYDDLNKQMILMYKDEKLRNQLIEHCAVQADIFLKEKALQALQTIVL